MTPCRAQQDWKEIILIPSKAQGWHNLVNWAKEHHTFLSHLSVSLIFKPRGTPNRSKDKDTVIYHSIL